MGNLFSNLVNNLSKGIHRIKCKYGHDDKKCETCGIKYKYCDCFLECIDFKDELIEYKRYQSLTRQRLQMLQTLSRQF